MPVAAICAGVPQLKAPQLGISCQLLFSAMAVCPEKRVKTGSARTPGTKRGGVDIDGPRPRISTVFGTVPSMIKPPTITLSPVCTNALVDKFTSGASLGTNTLALEITNILPCKNEST